MSDQRIDIATITITRSLIGDAGDDVVYVTAENTSGGELAIVEALGLLELGRIHLSARAIRDADPDEED